MRDLSFIVHLVSKLAQNITVNCAEYPIIICGMTLLSYLTISCQNLYFRSKRDHTNADLSVVARFCFCLLSETSEFCVAQDQTFVSSTTFLLHLLVLKNIWVLAILWRE